MTDFASLGFSQSLYGIGMPLALPEARPRAALDVIEVADFHHLHAALAHEGQAAVEVEHLDAVGGRRQDTAHKLGVGLFLRGGVALLRAVAERLDETLVRPVEPSQRGHVADRVEPAAVFAQMPAHVLGMPLVEDDRHLLPRAAGSPVLRREDPLDGLPAHFLSRPAQDALGPDVPVGHIARGVRDDYGHLARAVENRALARLALGETAPVTVRFGDVDLAAEAVTQAALAVEDGSDEQGVDEGCAVPTVVGDLDGEVAIVEQRCADLLDVVGLGVRTLEEPAVATDDLVNPVTREVEEGAVREDDGVVVLVGIREDHRQAGLVDGGEQHIGIGCRLAVPPLVGMPGQPCPQAQDLRLKLLAREAVQIAIHRKVSPPPATDVVHGPS